MKSLRPCELNAVITTRQLFEQLHNPEHRPLKYSIEFDSQTLDVQQRIRVFLYTDYDYCFSVIMEFQDDKLPTILQHKYEFKANCYERKSK